MKFLLFVDKNGKVEKIHWSFPKDLFKVGQCIGDPFQSFSGETISTLIANVFAEELSDFITVQLTCNTENIPVSVYALKVQDSVMVMGFNDEQEKEAIFFQFIKIYNSFVNSTRKEYKKLISEREESVRFKFEEIQVLNNELTNTKRLLEKTVAQLNLANSVLKKHLIFDSLTGLIGRYQYWAQVQAEIIAEPEKFGVFIFIDIDDFKYINDTYGHTFGDQYLIEFAKRMQTFPSKESIKIRMGGDEFALYYHGFDHVDNATIQTIWEEIQEYVISQPIKIDEFVLPVSLSAGMAVYGKDAFDIATLIEYADFAMYQTKRHGKSGYTLFDQATFEYENLRRKK